MEKHIITPEAIKEIETALANGENWIVYNTIPYFLEKGDVFCFKDEYEAKEFAHQNISDWDLLNVFHAKSIGDAYKKITSHDMDRAPRENLNPFRMTKGSNEEELRKEKKATPANDASQSKLKTKPNNTLLPKKSKNNRKGLHFS